MKTISVALCTYNGQAYLKDQLDSLLGQILPPDEVIVVDDGSCDATISIIEEFANNAAFRVRIYRNHERLGAFANFSRAVSLCTGDIIALCDQDDIWLPEKLICIDQAFNDPSVGLVYCDAVVVDENLQPLGFRWWQRVMLEPGKMDSQVDSLQACLLKRFRVPGACMAIHGRLVQALLPLPAAWMHDAWFSLVASAITVSVAIDRPLQLYRQHGSNVIGASQKSFFAEVKNGLTVNREEFYRMELVRWKAYLERLEELDAPAHARLLAEEKLAHLRRRSNLPRFRIFRIPMVMREVLGRGYYRFARNWGSVALDLLIK